MEQFLTGNIWETANSLIDQNKKTACIAYVTSESLNLSNNDILICDASEYAIKFGETSAKTIAAYFKKGVKIYSNQQLHAKLLLTDNLLIIGSANLSRNSAQNLIESSIVTDNEVLISQAKAFCYNLETESILLTEKHIESLLNIKVIKRQNKPIIKSETREKEFGDSYWYISVHPLKETALKKIKKGYG